MTELTPGIVNLDLSGNNIILPSLEDVQDFLKILKRFKLLMNLSLVDNPFFSEESMEAYIN